MQTVIEKFLKSYKILDRLRRDVEYLENTEKQENNYKPYTGRMLLFNNT